MLSIFSAFPHQPLRVGDSSRDRSFAKSLKGETGEDIDDGDDEELNLESEGECDNVQDESNGMCRGEKDVGAECA